MRTNRVCLAKAWEVYHLLPARDEDTTIFKLFASMPGSFPDDYDGPKDDPDAGLMPAQRKERARRRNIPRVTR